jgi:hypothetical protein
MKSMKPHGITGLERVKDSPNLESNAFPFVSLYWFNSSANFAAVLVVELIFG